MSAIQACSCNSDLTPSLGTSICHKHSPKKKEKKRNGKLNLSGNHKDKAYGLVIIKLNSKINSKTSGRIFLWLFGFRLYNKTSYDLTEEFLDLFYNFDI